MKKYKKRTVSVFLSISCIVFLCGCASPKTGCSSNQTWYQPDKTGQQTMRDLAMCQNEALAYGRSPNMGSGDGGARDVAFAMIANGSESRRQNDIVKTCMIAKGYTIIDKSASLAVDSQAVSNWNPPSSQDANLILLGHWVCVVTNSFSGKAGKFEYFFQPQNHYKGFLDDGSGTNQIEEGRYYTSGNKLTTWSDKDAEPETFIFVLKGRQLIITMLGTPFAFQKVEEESDADKRVANDLIGHWDSIEFKGNEVGEGVQKLEMDFLPNNRCEGTTIQDGKTYLIKGQYTVRGDKLIIQDASSSPQPATYSLIGNHLVVTYVDGGAEVIFQRGKKAP
jgi:hypothetical protein